MQMMWLLSAVRGAPRMYSAVPELQAGNQEDILCIVNYRYQKEPPPGGREPSRWRSRRRRLISLDQKGRTCVLSVYPPVPPARSHGRLYSRRLHSCFCSASTGGISATSSSSSSSNNEQKGFKLPYVLNESILTTVTEEPLHQRMTS